MPDNKLYTAKQAAQAVLAKASEMLAKAEMPKHLAAPAEKDQTGPQGVKADPNPAAPNDKVNGNPAPGALPQNHVKFAAEGLKGHLKLAKFVGRMEEKRKSKTVTAPAEPTAGHAAPGVAPMGKGEISESTNPKSKLKGIHQAPDWQPQKGKSHAGTAVRSSVGNGRHGSIGQGEIAEAKETHKEVLGEMKKMPKPKLPG